jgi:hypothetical protein
MSCPIERNASSLNLLIAEVLIQNPKIKRFCKTEITDQNKLEAVYLAKFRWNKEQEAKKAEEEKKRLEGEAAEEN